MNAFRAGKDDRGGAHSSAAGGLLRAKQKLLGTALGRAAMAFRERSDLLRTACFHPERVGTAANDLLARKLVTTLCQSGKTFVDMGAHIGSITAQVLHTDLSVRVVAIEAVPEKAAQLRKKFPGIEVHNCAAGETNGEVAFFVNLRQPGCSSLYKAEDGEGISEIRVPLKRVDDLLSSHDADVMKIDVEGAELGVLRGSAGLLARCRPVILFESGGDPDDGSAQAMEVLYRFLREKGYVIVVPNRLAHNGAGLTLEGFIESHLYPRRTGNYFATPEERRIEIRDRARRILGIPSG